MLVRTSKCRREEERGEILKKSPQVTPPLINHRTAIHSYPFLIKKYAHIEDWKVCLYAFMNSNWW